MRTGRNDDGPLARAPSLPEELARQLRRWIEEGRFAPGERLPSEAELTARFGVSRPVLREAMAQLRAEGWVHARQGSGVFVAEEPGGGVFRLATPDMADKEELRHILEFLIAFEGQATGLAAARRTAEELGRIEDALHAMARAIDAGASGIAEDVRFHARIVEASRNPLFVTFQGFLEHRCRKLIRTARENTARFEGLAHLVHAEHEAIFRAIRERDAEAARAAAETHLVNAAGRLRLYADERQG
jgi:GntR family transcriptional repressor for pyruvate dehydrogenase complex